MNDGFVMNYVNMDDVNVEAVLHAAVEAVNNGEHLTINNVKPGRGVITALTKTIALIPHSVVDANSVEAAEMTGTLISENEFVKPDLEDVVIVTGMEGDHLMNVAESIIDSTNPTTLIIASYDFYSHNP